MSSSIIYNSTTNKYQVAFDGKTIETTVTTNASVIDEWVRDITTSYANNTLANPAVVGLDIEWRQHPVRSLSNKTATLQLCIGTKCLIIQLFYIDSIPQSLKDFLTSSDFIFVGVEVADDAKELKDEYGLECCKTEDVRAAVMRRWPYRFRRPGLKDLALDLLGLRMNKTKESHL